MVIDSTDRERLAVTREELYRMLQHEDLSKASLLVYANKQVRCVTRARTIMQGGFRFAYIHTLRRSIERES